MMGTPEGAQLLQALVADDEMICVLLSKIFTQTSSLSMLKGFNEVKMVVGDSTTVLPDVINYVTAVVEVHSKVEDRIVDEEVPARFPRTSHKEGACLFFSPNVKIANEAKPIASTEAAGNQRSSFTFGGRYRYDF